MKYNIKLFFAIKKVKWDRKLLDLCCIDKKELNKKNLKKLIKLHQRYKKIEYKDLSTKIKNEFEYLINNLKK